jgi:hypothetical protein
MSVPECHMASSRGAVSGPISSVSALAVPEPVSARRATRAYGRLTHLVGCGRESGCRQDGLQLSSLLHTTLTVACPLFTPVDLVAGYVERESLSKFRCFECVTACVVTQERCSVSCYLPAISQGLPSLHVLLHIS